MDVLCNLRGEFILRCGAQFPILDYKLLGQCNPDSNKPCCNQVSGMCESGVENCECIQCTDFRSSIPAELGEWKPSMCQFKYLSHEETCDLFHRRKINMVFVGSF